MRDRKDVLIAVLCAALLFAVGVLVGDSGNLLPAASAQGGGSPSEGANAGQGGGDSSGNGTPAGFNPLQPFVGVPGAPSNPSAGGGGGGFGRPAGRLSTRITDSIYSDSNSNNRFIAVTSPIGSGEAVLFLIDSKTEQLAVYRFRRRKGLEFLAARKVDYDLKVTGYEDISKYSRDEMKRIYQKSIARAAAKAAKAAKKNNKQGG